MSTLSWGLYDSGLSDFAIHMGQRRQEEDKKYLLAEIACTTERLIKETKDRYEATQLDS